MPRWIIVVAVALPGAVLALIGLFHPAELDASTATRWWQLHVLLLPIFPLLAVALWVLLRGESGPLARIARVAAYVFAVYYTGLDTLAGIAAGRVVDVEGERGEAALALSALGNELAEVGVYAFAVAVVLTAVVRVRRDGRRALAGAVLLVVATVPFLHGHIYWPVGGLAMVGISAGCALLAATADLIHRSVHPD
ncbi:hypothetical protein [Pseudonocardia adelaidensis]|uniref:Uncharacterized protein n=1 Tax=Pseudonocardia adelaidensis TaxID=648754 RepID=A0ABP9NJP9_9PSEU